MRFPETNGPGPVESQSSGVVLGSDICQPWGFVETAHSAGESMFSPRLTKLRPRPGCRRLRRRRGSWGGSFLCGGAAWRLREGRRTWVGVVAGGSSGTGGPGAPTKNGWSGALPEKTMPFCWRSSMYFVKEGDRRPFVPCRPLVSSFPQPTDQTQPQAAKQHR